MFQVNLVGVIAPHTAGASRNARPTGGDDRQQRIHQWLCPLPAASTYAASKAGVVGFTESLRRELHGTGVHAMHLVTPGVATDMLSATDEVYGRHMDTSSWDRVPPRSGPRRLWARSRPTSACSGRADAQAWQCSPHVVPTFLLDAIADRSFSRKPRR